MFKRGLLLLLLTATSCHYFKSEEERTDQLVNQELMAINWNDVDQYPLFDQCSETVDKKEQLLCFQHEIMAQVETALQDTTFVVNNTVKDTLRIDFMVDGNGFISIVNIEESEALRGSIPEIQKEISARLHDLTTVAPALKRGIPVSMRFRLPIAINTKQ